MTGALEPQLGHLEALAAVAETATRYDAAAELFLDAAIAAVPNLVQALRQQRYALSIARRVMLQQGWHAASGEADEAEADRIAMREAFQVVSEALGG